jgi:eukaryotic-like serine/threonine-protein kinase
MQFDPIRVKELFHTAVAVPAAERDGYLDAVCGGDPPLRSRLEELLAAHARADDFLEPPEPAEAYRPGTRLGKYVLVDVIGEGAMGTVWVAEQTEPFPRLVAVKVVKPGPGARHVAGRFAAELRTLALMDHSGIAKVLDAGDGPGGRPFFVLELVRGRPITAYADEKRLPLRARLDLFVQVCRAVQHAHQKGIIHRDLKPSNVLVTEQEGLPVPKVIDFGIARAVGRGPEAGFTGVAGTLEYMSPEQADPDAADIDTRADVYSLGILLYELLTGSTPLARTTLQGLPLAEVLRRIQEESPPRPSEKLAAREPADRGLVRELRRDLDWVVLAALERDRDRRYPSASELAADVQRHLNGDPVAARPASRWYRAGRFVRRNRGPVVAGALVVLALAGGLGGTTSGLFRARHAEQDAVTARQNEQALRELAERRAADAVAAEAATNDVLGFFGESFLTTSRPAGVEGGAGLDAKLRDAVNWAEGNVGRAFADRPLAEARVRRLLGRTFGMHGEPARAVQQYERAAELSAAQLGPTHIDTLGTRGEMAVAYRFVGRYAEALRMLTDLTEQYTAVRGPGDPATMMTRLRLGSAHRDAGNYARAVEILEPLVARIEGRLGAEAAPAVSASLRLATAYRSAGRYEEAIARRKRGIAARQAAAGPDHVMTLCEEGDLAEDYVAAGRAEDAIPILRRVLPGLARHLGASYPAVLDYTATLGLACALTGRTEEAVSILEESAGELHRKLGPDNPFALDAGTKLARAYLAAGRPTDAVQVLERTVPRLKATIGPEHPTTAEAVAVFATARK